MHADDHPGGAPPVHAGKVPLQPGRLLGAGQVVDVAAEHDDVHRPRLEGVEKRRARAALGGGEPEARLVGHEALLPVDHLLFMLQPAKFADKGVFFAMMIKIIIL